MSRLKVILPAALVLGGFLVCSTASYAKPEYTKQTKKACSACHDPAKKQGGKDGSFNLTDAGKQFQAEQQKKK